MCFMQGYVVVKFCSSAFCTSASFAALNGGPKLTLLLLLLLLLLLPNSATLILSIVAGVLFLVVPFSFGNSQKTTLD